MSTDPQSPDYNPTYTGAPGNYGSGGDFGADLFALYTAGQLTMPDTAGTYSAAASELHWIIGTFSGVSGDLSHDVGNHISSIMSELFDAMRLTTNRIYAGADALVSIADDYVQTDEAAATEFNGLLKNGPLAGQFADPPPTIPPPGPDDPIGPPPDLPTSPEELDELTEGADAEQELDEQQEEDEQDDDSDGEG